MHNQGFRRCLSFPKVTREWIHKRLGEIDLFHIHSVFIPENALIANLGKPYVLTPNGGWSKAVINGKRKLAKRLWILLREEKMWKKAAIIQAVSREEKNQLDKLNGISAVRYIPNGVELPDPLLPTFRRDIFLYIGRMDINQKGLDILLDAVNLTKLQGAKMRRLIIAGPDYRGGRNFIESYVKEHGLDDRVEVRGVVHGDEKQNLFQRAALFVHTSRWEGLPLVLIEALAYGVPCLLTPGTNVAREWSQAGCAFETQGLPEEIALALVNLSGRSFENENRAARALASTEYSWSVINKDLKSTYKEVLAIK
jgi:glycosyltransferase involved in cell wall biosynthesis